jgi:hypothetical protein
LEEKMKNLKKVICLALAVIFLCPILTSCGNKMVMTGAGLTHKKTGVEYLYVLDPCYQPKEYETEPYTKWKYNDFTVEYYAVKGFEPTEWLYCPTLGELLCATGAELPSLEGFAPNGVFICVEANVPYSIYEIKDQATVDQILQRYMQAAEAFTKARNNANKGLTEERVEKLGEAILNLFVVIFGQEQAQKLVDFYGESYTEMLADVVPFINDVVAPKINEAQKRIMAQYQAAKVQRQGR